MSDKPLRAAMPLTTELIDACRAAGLINNDDIREGLRAGTFYASENGHTIGVPVEDEGVTPVLSYEAEKRLLDKAWSRRNRT